MQIDLGFRSQTDSATQLDPRPALARLLLISFQSYSSYSERRQFVNAGRCIRIVAKFHIG